MAPSAQSTTRPGHTVTNPVTGDTLTILESASDSDGGHTRIRFVLAPNAAGSPPHFHQGLTEIFTVEEGELALESGTPRKERRLKAGECQVIPPGEQHAFRNPSDAPTVMIVEVTPGQGFEKFILSLYGLAGAGKTDPTGAPKSLLVWVCLLLWSDFRVAGVPLRLQNAALSWLYRLAERCGTVAELSHYFDNVEKNKAR